MTDMHLHVKVVRTADGKGRYWGGGVNQSTSKLLLSLTIPLPFKVPPLLACAMASSMSCEHSYTSCILVTLKAILQTALQNIYHKPHQMTDSGTTALPSSLSFYFPL